MVEAWLARFEENWHEHKLGECLRALPPQSSVRRPLLLAMIERDLEHQWSQGRQLTLESYLSEYPELGRLDDLPIELIAAEFEVRHRYGQADLAEYAQRFPAAFDDLQIYLTPILEGGGSPEVSRGSASASSAERRLKLLTAPSDEPVVDPVGEHRLNLLQGSSRPGSGGESREPFPDSSWGGLPAVDNDLDFFLPPDLFRTDPTQPLTESPAETIWLEGEANRDTDNGATSASVVLATPSLPVPPILGRYQIERQLGRSGRGFTYQAIDTEWDRRVALKVPSFSGPDADARRERFLREARVAAGLSHPLLCPVLEVGQADGFDFLVMPFVEGESLHDLMKARPIWPVRQAVDLFFKLTSAMDAAHRQGVIHRSLKPTNVLITPGEIPVIVGFGQVTRPDPADDGEDAVYLAPEWSHHQPDDSSPRGDIYSIAAMLYQIVTGNPPPHPLEMPAPLSFPDDIPPDLKSICERALSRDPELRYATMREFAQDLARFRDSLAPSNPSRRLSLSGSQLRPSTNRRPPSAEASNEMVPVGNLPASSGANGPANATHFCLQQIRQMSTGEMPALKTRGSSPVSRRFAWEWVVVGTFSVILLTVVIVRMNLLSRPTKQAEPDPVAAPGTALPSMPPPAPSATDLVRRLAQLEGDEYHALAKELKGRRDPAITQAAIDYLVSAPWSDVAPKGRDRDAVLALLLALDPLSVPDTLRRSTRSPDAEVRGWAFREIGRRIDLDTRARLVPALLAGLKDTSGLVRHIVAEQVRQLPPPHEAAIVQALFDRVADSMWGEPDAAVPDGGKNAALDALEEYAPNRVKAALQAAEQSTNPEVRRWAATQKARRSSP